MYQVCIVMNNTDANLSMSFKTSEAAKAVYDQMATSMAGDAGIKIPGLVQYVDDFGYQVSTLLQSISYVLFCDIEKSQWVMFEKDMAVNRARVKIQDSLEAQGFAPTQQPPEKKSIILPN